MKIGVVVVFFNPSSREIKYWTECSSSSVHDFVFVDNSSDPVLAKVDAKPAHLITNFNRGGIAGALNRGFDLLIREENSELVFSFDQDSVLPKDFFEEMASFTKNKKSDFVAPDFYDVNSKTHATFIRLNKWSYRKVHDGVAHFAITSGMGVSSRAYLSLGTFREDYVIDHVDTEYCLRALKEGYVIKVNYDVCLKHSIGQRSVERFLGVCLKPNHHGETRKYYTVRNGLHSSLLYFRSYPSYFILNILRTGHEMACVLLYEKEKKVKIEAMLKAIFHGVVGKLGYKD